MDPTGTAYYRFARAFALRQFSAVYLDLIYSTDLQPPASYEIDQPRLSLERIRFYPYNVAINAVSVVRWWAYALARP